MVPLKELPHGILDRDSEEAEFNQGNKEITWDVTRGNIQVRKKRVVRSMIWFTHVLSNQALSLNCNNEMELNLLEIKRNRNRTDGPGSLCK